MKTAWSWIIGCAVAWGCSAGSEEPGDDAGPEITVSDGFAADLLADGFAADLLADGAAPEAPGELPVLDGPAPDGPGLFQVTTVEDQVLRGDRTIPVVAHMPEEAEGPLPLIVFLPGFQAKSDWYAGTMDYLASHGFVVVRAQPPGGFLDVNHVEMAADVTAVLDWALNPAGPLEGRADPDRIGLTGHSLGGKIATMSAFRDGRATALLPLDPVNGGNPFTGFTEELPDIVPDEVAPLAIPVGFIGETPSAQGSSDSLPACAPADGNFTTFYEAAASAPWKASWDLLEAGHMDFVDDFATCGFACELCVRGNADPTIVLATVRTLATAFFRRHLLGETAMDAWLIGPGLPQGVAVKHSF